MKSLLRLIAAFVFIAGLYSLSHALSPFQTVAGVGGPMPGTSLNCVSVVVSSFTGTSVLAANSLREALFVVNTSTQGIAGGARLPVVFISTFSVQEQGIADIGTVATGMGIPLAAANWEVTKSTETGNLSSRWEMSGGAIYQGPVFAIGTDVSPGVPRVSACEMNP